MVTMINRKIGEYFRKRYQKKHWRPLIPEMKNIFRAFGEGLYYVNMKQSGTSLISKLISIFSRGYVHSVTILYSEKLSERLNDVQKLVVKSKMAFYYIDPPALDDIKVLVLASADDSGMNFFDFSNYQLRKMSIRKVRENYDENKVIDFMFHNALIDYDYTGLAFWCLRMFDDEKAYYCSEICYDAFIRAGIKIAEKPDPSCWDIEKYRRDRIVYDCS